MEDIDVAALGTLLEAAWQTDYGAQWRLVYDAASLPQVMGEPGCLACVIQTTAGEFIGFRLAQARTLYCHGHSVRAYYNTLFTVSPCYRGQGLGAWIVQAMDALLLQERKADVLCSTFHIGQAGLPVVQRTLARMPGRDLRLLHTAHMWGRRLERVPLPPVAEALEATQKTLSGIINLKSLFQRVIK
jgi:GNAT superfamily N-acetyltransferase